MFPHWITVVALWSTLMLLLTGCGPVSARSSDPPADVYLAALKAWDQNQVASPRIANRVGGNITIINGLSGEIAADVTATGVGASFEQALEEADSHINLINTGNEITVDAVPGANAQDRAQLYVRVPLGSNLPSITATTGNVTVNGRVGDVIATITQSGDISVGGASGEINLSTARGSVSAKLAPDRNNVTANANNGNIEIMAVTALVSASTVNGNIRFVGTLRNERNNTFSIAGNGDIDVALPAYQPGQMSAQPYRISATTTTNPIISDYPPTVTVNGKPSALTICGFVYSSGPYDYHIENTPTRHFGRIEISPVLTASFFFTGTLGADFYRFDTNRTAISLYTPVPQSIHLYTAEQLKQMMAGKASIDPGCKGALNSPDPSAIQLNLKTDRGRIYIRHVLLKQE